MAPTDNISGPTEAHSNVVNMLFDNQRAAGQKTKEEGEIARQARIAEYSPATYTNIPVVPEEMDSKNFHMNFEEVLEQMTHLDISGIKLTDPDEYKRAADRASFNVREYRQKKLEEGGTTTEQNLSYFIYKISSILTDKIDELKEIIATENKKGSNITHYSATIMDFTDLGIQVSVKGELNSDKVQLIIYDPENQNPSFKSSLTFALQGQNGKYTVGNVIYTT